MFGKQIDIQNLWFTVYPTSKGSFGVSLRGPGFQYNAYLDPQSGDALYGSHPVLGPKWAVAKRELVAKLSGLQTADSAPVQTETKRGPGRPRRVKASEVEAPKAETPAPAQGMDPQVKAALEALNAKIAAMAELMIRKSA